MTHDQRRIREQKVEEHKTAKNCRLLGSELIKVKRIILVQCRNTEIDVRDTEYNPSSLVSSISKLAVSCCTIEVQLPSGLHLALRTILDNASIVIHDGPSGFPDARNADNKPF